MKTQNWLCEICCTCKNWNGLALFFQLLRLQGYFRLLVSLDENVVPTSTHTSVQEYAETFILAA